jgi:hypothetical protein
MFTGGGPYGLPLHIGPFSRIFPVVWIDVSTGILKWSIEDGLEKWT